MNERHPPHLAGMALGLAAWAALALGALAGCAGVRPDSQGGGGRTGVGVGAGGNGASGECNTIVHAVVRDFRGFQTLPDEPKHPDFEYVVGALSGIVKNAIGSDLKPVYAPTGPTTVTNGPDDFNQWYRDVDMINIPFQIDIPLTPAPGRDGVVVFDSNAFFPIDGQGWGNQYQTHNYDFTTEIHFDFPYRGGETFTFRGDDDVWVFVNGTLAIDLGGVHEAETGSVDLDQMAATLGIARGSRYRMDIFHAERHVVSSTFHIETSLNCIVNIIP